MNDEIFSIIRNGLTEQYRQSISNTTVDCNNEYGQNLLQEAIAYCRDDIAVDLIKRGIDINHEDRTGQTPLHYCAQYNNVAIAELLLEKKAKLNITDSYGNNPLWYAVFNASDDYHLVKLFVKYGADALNKNKAMRTPLDFAKQIGETEMINILFRRFESEEK